MATLLHETLFINRSARDVISLFVKYNTSNHILMKSEISFNGQAIDKAKVAAFADGTP